VKTGTRYDSPETGMQLICQAGEGTFGATYLLRNSEEYFILKVQKASNLETFIEEGEAIRKYGSNASLHVLEIGGKDVDLIANEKPYILMDYIPGISLHELLEEIRENGTDFKMLTKYKIIFGIARGLALLHQNNVTHRDIKPGNIFIDQDFHPHIGDFGDVSSHSVTENVHGTVNFLPPEAKQPQGTPIPCNPPYDVFEFGGTLFQILTYEWPFNDINDSPILDEYTSKGKRDDRVERGELTILDEDKPLYEIVKMCWEQNPEDRPTMDDIVAWIYDGASKKLGEDFPEFERYALSISEEKEIFGTYENVRKAIENGFATYNGALATVANLDGTGSGSFRESVNSVTENRNRPPSKSIRF